MRKIFNKPFNDFRKSLESLKINAKKSLWSLGKDAFLLILIFILTDILLGELLFYKYVFLVKNQEPKIASSVTRFKKGTYDAVIKEWQDKENIFKNSTEINYQDPFK